MKCFRVSFFLVSSFSLTTAYAELRLVLTGTPGSPVVHYTTSGSVTVSQSAPEVRSSGVSRAPDSGLWNIEFDNNLGDFLTDFASTFNDNLLLSNPVPIFVNGIQLDKTEGDERNTGVFDTIDLDPSDASGEDDVEFDPVAEIAYPAVNPGDVVSWGEVTGTFTLESGNFEDVFSATGSFFFSDVFELVIEEEFLGPVVVGMSVDPITGFQLTTKARPDFRYVLESSSDLMTWSLVETQTAVAELLTFTQPAPLSEQPFFYRVVEMEAE